jgi:hypothetical protein
MSGVDPENLTGEGQNLWEVNPEERSVKRVPN